MVTDNVGGGHKNDEAGKKMAERGAGVLFGGRAGAGDGKSGKFRHLWR